MKKKLSQYIAGSIPADGADDYIPNGLFWTTEKPTVPGTYWVFVFHTVETVKLDKKLQIDWQIHGWEIEEPFEEKDITHWLGPLPEPEPPKSVKRKIVFDVEIANSFSLHPYMPMKMPNGDCTIVSLEIEFEPLGGDVLRDAENALDKTIKEKYPGKDYLIQYWTWMN